MRAFVYFYNKDIIDKVKDEITDKWYVTIAENEHQIEDYALNKEYELVMLPADISSRLIDEFRKAGNKPVIFLIGTDEMQSVKVYKNRCDGFVKTSDLTDDLQFCLKRCGLSDEGKKKLKAVTFGRFDIFYNERLIDFKNRKAKELLALCIDRMGGEVTMEEIIDKLWPDRVYDDRVKRLYRKAVTYLRELFSQLGEGSFFVTKRAVCCIVKDMINCDYFDLLSDPEKYKFLYNGEYMFDYTWAEQTNAILQKKFKTEKQYIFYSD